MSNSANSARFGQLTATPFWRSTGVCHVATWVPGGGGGFAGADRTGGLHTLRGARGCLQRGRRPVSAS
eukprot:473339-Pyramimonas_sp.AAC.1